MCCSGREGESLLVGFAARKSEIALYGLQSAVDADVLLAKLGKHKTVKACIYVKSLVDIDLNVLKKLVVSAANDTRRVHGRGKGA